MTQKFSQKVAVFANVGKWLVCLACTPVLVYHWWMELTGLALAAILGIPFADWTVLFPTNWASQLRARRDDSTERRQLLASFRSRCFFVALALSAFMIVNAALVVSVIRAKNVREEGGKVGVELAKAMSGGKGQKAGPKLAEQMRLAVQESAGRATETEQKILAFVPAWYLSSGIFIALPLASLLGFALILHKAHVVAGLDDDDEDEQTARPVKTASPVRSDDDWTRSPAYAKGSQASRSSVSDLAHFRANDATRDATQNANDATRDATPNRDATRDATQGGGLEIVRDALRDLAKPGHFYFKAETKSNGVLIRQCAGVKGREEVLTSCLVPGFKLLLFAQKHQANKPYIVGSLKAMMIRKGFDLEKEMK